VEKELALYYGAASTETQPRADRDTVVLDDAGCLILTYEDVNPLTHPKEVLDDLEELLE